VLHAECDWVLTSVLLCQHLKRQGIIPSGKQKSVLCRNKNSVLKCRM
jgi:hypothetical protein